MRIAGFGAYAWRVRDERNELFEKVFRLSQTTKEVTQNVFA